MGPLFYKILLMNTANTIVYQDYYGGTLAPITRIGGGRVDVLNAFNSGTIAWDSYELRAGPALQHRQHVLWL